MIDAYKLMLFDEIPEEHETKEIVLTV